MARMIVGSIASKRSISTLSHLCERIKQTENEVVQMFQLSTPKDEMHNLPMRGKLPRKDPAVRTLDERFIRILKIFKWGPDAEKALEVLKLRVDHRLVREVLKIDVELAENEIVQMFQLSTPKDEMHNLPMRGKLPRKDPAVRTLDERFIRILKIFKWGPDAEKALEVLKLRVDHRLVREVLKIDVEVNVKIQFFKWAGKRRNFEW
ncbi:pentatricopeptide repeat-containing protein [Quercus suber]|uniref:Pentatricopeptide repeat-containing protein n=1 Tax=Quercus suber TaxID=58331 RepID=A0AAW0IQK1_QUESU